MDKVSQRSGPRSLLKRGPKAARLLRAAVPVERVETQGSESGGMGVDAADSRLRNYRRHFIGGSENETYFRATRTIVTAARRWRKLANDRVKPIGQTMVRMLDVPAKDGLIARRQSSADRRVTSNPITPKGMRAIRDIMEITDKVRSEVMGTIDPRRLEIFIDVSTQILRNVDELSFSEPSDNAYPFDRTTARKTGRKVRSRSK